jgi:CheY-like chemotaxis protein
LLKYQKKTYDVILTDIEMPEMNGYELTEKIRRLEENTDRATAIFAITASDYDLTEGRAKSLGFNDYMLKPLDVAVLKRKLADSVRLAPKGFDPQQDQDDP